MVGGQRRNQTEPFHFMSFPKIWVWKDFSKKKISKKIYTRPMSLFSSKYYANLCAISVQKYENA